MTDATSATRRRFLRGAAVFALATAAVAALGRLTRLVPARASVPTPGEAVPLDRPLVTTVQSEMGAGHDPCLGAFPRT